MNENEIDDVARKKRAKWENIFLAQLTWIAWEIRGLRMACVALRTKIERTGEKNENWADVPK